MSDHVTLNSDSAYSKYLRESFTVFREDQRYVDCKILVGQDTIECHAVIVSALSPVLDKMLGSAMSEGLKKEVTFDTDTVSVEVMKMIIEYMYTGTITMAKSLIMDIVKACDYLQVEELKIKCLQYIPHILTPYTAISWLRVADLLHLDNATTQCKKYMAEHFEEIVKGEDFLDLSVCELKECLLNAKIKIAPDNILSGLFLWISFDDQNRTQDLGDLLQYVKLQNCTDVLLRQIIEQYESILNHNPLFYKALTKVYVTRNLSLGVIGKGKFWKLNCRSKNFEEYTQIPQDFKGTYSVCTCKDIGLILTGGYVSAMYYVATGKWKNLTKLKSNRSDHASVCVQGELFIIGGDIRSPLSHWVSSVEWLQIDNKHAEWQDAPSVPSNHRPAPGSIVSLNSDVFHAGGRQLYHFDPLRKVWSERSELPGLYFDKDDAMAAGDGHIYLVILSNGCHVYNISTDTWVKIPKQTLYHKGGALVFHQDKLILLGGLSSHIEEYDIEQSIWKTAPFKLPEDLYIPFAFMMDLPN